MAHKQPEDQLPPFGEEAHRVLARTRAAGHLLRHATLGTEHLLIGCVEETRGQAAEVLHRAGVTPALVMSCVSLLGNRTVASLPEELQMAPVLRAALRTAGLEARRLGDGEVRSEHLLLGILRERTGGGSVVLRAAGMDPLALRAAIVRGRVGEAASKSRAAVLARGPYGALAVIGGVAVVVAVIFVFRWFATVQPVVRSAYVYELLVPVALISIGMVGIGANWVEAARQAADREELLASWAARGAVAQLAAALALAQAGLVEAGAELLLAAVDRDMPESDVRAALPVLARWLANEQLAPYGYLGRGLLRAHAGQMPVALTDLEAATRLRPDSARWQGLYGAWLARAGRDDEALPHLREAVSSGIAEPLIALELALVRLRRGEVAEAESMARRAAEALPGASHPLSVAAAARFLQGKTDTAEETLESTRLADAQDTLAQATRACILLRRQRADEALSVLRDAAASTVERPGYLAALEGWALTALGNEREAALAYAEARTRDPRLQQVLGHVRDALVTNHLDEPARELEALLAGLAQ